VYTFQIQQEQQQLLRILEIITLYLSLISHNISGLNPMNLGALTSDGTHPLGTTHQNYLAPRIARQMLAY
jgi:hypothetical protein